MLAYSLATTPRSPHHEALARTIMAAMPSPPRATAVLIAWAAFAISWFLPAVHVKPGGLIGDIDAGWKAFLLALSMALKPDRLEWFWGLCIAGVLANLPVVLTLWHFRRDPAMKPRDPEWRARAIPSWLAIALAAAFLINLSWIVVMSDTVLLVGYWLWIGSIGILAVIAILHHRRTGAT